MENLGVRALKFTQTELQIREMQLKVGLKATTYVREKFCNIRIVCNKTHLSYILPILDFHILENSMKTDQESSWISRYFLMQRIFAKFEKTRKTKVPPDSPLPYLINKGMSHTFDILQISFFKIFKSLRSFISVGFFCWNFQNFLKFQCLKFF